MNQNTLTLISQESKIDKLTLYEPIDMKILDKLINSDLLKVTFNNPLCAGYENEKQFLLCYKKLIKNGKAEVKYTRARGIKYGRVNPLKAQGLFSIRREIRHSLAKGTFIDIDIENCHPVLLLQICQKHNIVCKYLKKYVENRDDILLEIINYYGVSRDEAKKLFIRLMYFGTFENWLKDIKDPKNTTEVSFLKKFKSELNNIGNLIIASNPELKKAILNKKDDDNNIIGSVCSYYLQEYECRILEAVYLYCVENRYIQNNVAVLCADGLMIEEKLFNNKLLDELVEVVEKGLGFKVKFTTKDFNQDYLSILNDHLIASTKDKVENEIVGVFNDLEAAHVVFKLYPHFICCNSILYVFDDETGLWTDKEEIIFKIITRFKEFLYLLTLNNKNEIKQSKKGYGDSSSLKKQMIPELKTLCINNNWESSCQFSSIGKLLFLNGVYDMKTGIFTEGFDSKVVFHNKIYRIYNPKLKKVEYIKDVLKRFIYNQLGEIVGNYFLLQIARGLAGDMMKKFICGLGEADAGKSTIVKACVSSFDEYIGSFNAESLCFRNTSSDEAAQMRWAYLLRYKRIIFSSEIKMNTEINGNMIKKISSGGDKLIARVHGGLETEFVPHFLGVSYSNDQPKISGIDTDPAINNRMKFVTYTKKYVKEPTNEYELKIDDNIDEEINSVEFKNAFQFIIFDIYLNYIQNGKQDIEPEEIKQFKIEWVGETKDKTIFKFLESFEITDNINQFTMSKEIEDWLIKEKIGITMTKFTMELKKYCKLKNYFNVISKDKKIAGKCRQAWFGIKTNDDDNDNGLDV